MHLRLCQTGFLQIQDFFQSFSKTIIFFQTQGCQVGDQQTSQKHNSKAFFMLYFKHMGKFE